MQVIEREGWYRSDHFQLYSGFEFPHVNICVQVDITQLWTKRSLAGTSPTITLVYTITRAGNRIPELRQRIRGDEIIQHEVVHPLITVLGENDLFGVTTLTYDPDFKTFASRAAAGIAQAKEGVSMKEFPHDQEGNFSRDDLLSITILPWLAFTGFAITRKPSLDCIPLIAFGKVQEVDDCFQLPLFVNFHHALADGLHVARFVKYIEEEGKQLAMTFE